MLRERGHGDLEVAEINEYLVCRAQPFVHEMSQRPGIVSFEKLSLNVRAGRLAHAARLAPQEIRMLLPRRPERWTMSHTLRYLVGGGGAMQLRTPNVLTQCPNAAMTW